MVAITTLGWGAMAASGAPTPALPEPPTVGPSILRLVGAFALVMVVLLGGFWFLRNGVRFAPRNGVPRKLKVLEVRMLGQRQSLFVVGYEGRRLLLGSSAAGVTFLTRLPSVSDEEASSAPAAADLTPSFTDALRQALGHRA